jgi:hypothetical protein
LLIVINGLLTDVKSLYLTGVSSFLLMSPASGTKDLRRDQPFFSSRTLVRLLGSMIFCCGSLFLDSRTLDFLFSLPFLCLDPMQFSRELLEGG